MKLSDFRQHLAELDGDLEVIIARDAEGNSYSPLASCEVAVYRPDTTWRGETYPAEITDEMRFEGWTDDALCHGGDCWPAVVFWPAN